VLRSDVIRKTLLGVAPSERLEPDAYNEDISLRVYEIMVSRTTTLLAAGHAAIVDAVYLDPDHRARIERVATELGVPFRGLWLRAPASTLTKRVQGRSGDASDATTAVVASQLEADPGPLTWDKLDAGTDPETIADAARAALAG